MTIMNEDYNISITKQRNVRTAMVDPRGKVDLRWLKRVIGWEVDVEVIYAACVRAVFWACGIKDEEEEEEEHQY